MLFSMAASATAPTRAWPYGAYITAGLWTARVPSFFAHLPVPLQWHDGTLCAPHSGLLSHIVYNCRGVLVESWPRPFSCSWLEFSPPTVELAQDIDWRFSPMFLMHEAKSSLMAVCFFHALSCSSSTLLRCCVRFSSSLLSGKHGC